jgi:hypothetical protein
MAPWIIANVHRKPNSGTIPLSDFMPRPADAEEDNRAGQLALAADLRAMAKANSNIKYTAPDGEK